MRALRVVAGIAAVILCSTNLLAQSNSPQQPPISSRPPNTKQSYDEQEKNLLAAVQAAESGSADATVITRALESLARFYSSHNRKVELSGVLDRELAAAEKAYPKDDATKVRTLQQIAMGYRLCNERDRAEQLYRRILEIHTGLFGLNSQDVATDLLDLGRTTMFKTDSPDAQEYLMKALAIDQLRNDDRAASDVIQALSTTAKLQKDPEKADALLASAINALKIHADVNALKISELLFQRANIAAGRKDYNTAIDDTRQVLAIQQAHFATDSPLIFGTLSNLSNFFLLNNDFNSADEYIHHALDLAEADDKNSPGHISEAGPLSTMAHLYTEEKKYDEAEAAIKRALELVANVRGKDDPSLARNTAQLAYIYAVQGKNAEAETQYRRTIALAEVDQTGIVGHSMPEFLADYAFFLKKLNRNEEADSLLKRAREIVEKRRAAVQNQTPQF